MTSSARTTAASSSQSVASIATDSSTAAKLELVSALFMSHTWTVVEHDSPNRLEMLLIQAKPKSMAEGMLEALEAIRRGRAALPTAVEASECFVRAAHMDCRPT